jgi:WD40 repeat protein
MGFSSDSHYLAAGSIGNFVYVWQVRDGLRVARLPGHDSQFNGLAWSPLVATPLLLTASPGNNGGAYIWNAQTFAPTADSYQRRIDDTVGHSNAVTVNPTLNPSPAVERDF